MEKIKEKANGMSFRLFMACPINRAETRNKITVMKAANLLCEIFRVIRDVNKIISQATTAFDKCLNR